MVSAIFSSHRPPHDALWQRHCNVKWIGRNLSAIIFGWSSSLSLRNKESLSDSSDKQMSTSCSVSEKVLSIEQYINAPYVTDFFLMQKIKMWADLSQADDLIKSGLVVPSIRNQCYMHGPIVNKQQQLWGQNQKQKTMLTLIARFTSSNSCISVKSFCLLFTGKKCVQMSILRNRENVHILFSVNVPMRKKRWDWSFNWLAAKGLNKRDLWTGSPSVVGSVSRVKGWVCRH